MPLWFGQKVQSLSRQDRLILVTQEAGTVHPVDGVRLSAVAANIRYPDKMDLVLIELTEDTVVSGVFTQNAFCAAPVEIAKRNLLSNSIRYFLINTGFANAGTGDQGILDAEQCCSSLAAHVDASSKQVLPFSTGVIGESMPVEKIENAIPQLCSGLAPDNWLPAAQGIMTTDTQPKLESVQLSIQGKTVSVSGIAKGAGMIRPNMATMLAYVFTDLAVERPALDGLLNEAVSQSFNRITVDGDTSTNDCCMLAATGASNISLESLSDSESTLFVTALNKVFQQLAIGLIRDAEGASKFVTIKVENGATSEECLQVAYTIAESPLVKTALFASDPNWGRILAAIGRAGLADLNISDVFIFIGDCLIVINGAVAPQYKEALGQKEMNKDEIDITIKLGRGDSSETIWTSDLSHDYVRINAEYRT